MPALEQLGAATLSTDQVVHELYATREVRDAVIERFGHDVAPAGEIDRAQLAERAFATPPDREWLEGMLWPRVGARILDWRRQLDHSPRPPRAAVVEVPLLFEAGMEPAFDCTIAVLADEAIRARRAQQRGHRSLEERSSRQLSQEEKAARATYVVRNNGSPGDLMKRLSEVLDMLER